MTLAFQTVDQEAPLNRTRHVWMRLPTGYVTDPLNKNHGKPVPHRDGDPWKCVVCGGVTVAPSDNSECREYRPLTDAERTIDACLPRGPAAQALPPAQPTRGRGK